MQMPILATVVLALNTAALGQGHSCLSHVDPAEMPALRRQQLMGAYELQGGIAQDLITVKIKWHVIANTDGDRAISAVRLATYLDQLNDAYAPMQVAFCADPVEHVIVNNQLFNNVTDSYSLRRIEPTLDAIDIYWCPRMNGGSGCGISSFTTSGTQGIVMASSCAGYTNVIGVLIHEVGHYFDLYHTHETAFGLDCPSSSGCSHDGDLVCDTPPSPNLNMSQCVINGSCQFRSTCSDSPTNCGEVPWDPDTRNFMSYTTVPCLERFTQGQYDRARATLMNLRPELLAVTCEEPCPGEFNDDGQVDGRDLQMLLGAWGTSHPVMDTNQDGIVDGGDLNQLLASWGPC